MNNFYKTVIGLLLILLTSYFFDKALFAGIFFIGLLTLISIIILQKAKCLDKYVYLLFFGALFLHIIIAILIYYTNFQPLGPGDFVWYQEIAEQIFQRIYQGNFSLQGMVYLHYYPVLMGIIYSFTAPKMIVSQLFSAWLLAVSVLMIYFIVLKVGGSKKSGFLAGLLVLAYPSYIYFGSLMLKDTLIVPLVLFALLLQIKMFKDFTAIKFLMFFTVLVAVTHLRFYIGLALIFSFIICWVWLSSFKWTERFIYGITFIFLLGFVPQILGYGYYGSVPLLGYLNKKTITTYREVYYAPKQEESKNNVLMSGSCGFVKNSGSLKVPDSKLVEGENPSECKKSANADFGTGSSFVVSTGFDSPFSFIKNYMESFIYAFLGPFPWQFQNKKYFLFLAETIPWYLFLILVIYEIYKSVKSFGFLKTFNKGKFVIPILLFGLMTIGALSLFINNFGIIIRIRMPVFIAFLSFIIFIESNVWYNRFLQFKWKAGR